MGDLFYVLDFIIEKLNNTYLTFEPFTFSLMNFFLTVFILDLVVFLIWLLFDIWFDSH